MSFIPNEVYPYRIALDIVEHIASYIKDKVVCDVGCGSGDLLEYIKHKKYAKCVLGIEVDKNRASVKERQYIQLGDVFKLGLPEADVYTLWLGVQFPYEQLFKQIENEKIIIYMDGAEINHQIFSNYKGITLIETINYEYNEEKFIPENQLEDWKVKWPTRQSKGTRLCKIYKYTPC